MPRTIQVAIRSGVTGRTTGYSVAMFGPRTLARPLLAAPFIISAVGALRAPEVAAIEVEEVGVPLAEKVGLPTDPVALVNITAGVQLGASALLIFGILPRPAAIALGATLVPNALAKYRFWETKDASQRMNQIVELGKTAGLIGGALMAAIDTGGRPSVFWSGRKAAGRAADSLSDFSQKTAGSVNNAYHSIPGIS